MIDDIRKDKLFEEEDDDEFDIVKLVSTNANNSNQYLIFNGSNGELYAKNVSKIEELIVYKDIEISHNTTDTLILGTADIRGKMTPIMYFDKWFGSPTLDDSEYELVILANYGKRRFGMVVKSVEFITSIEAENMSDNSMSNSKTTFVTKVKLNGSERICTIFDGDKLLLDVFGEEELNFKNIERDKKISDKIVLFADDSKFIREMVRKVFESLKLNYIIFEDGEALIKELEKMDITQLGLVITDLEMPNKDGKAVISFMRDNDKFSNIKIVVHTNMSNNIMETDLLDNGADEIIGKVDLNKLSESIIRNIIK